MIVYGGEATYAFRPWLKTVSHVSETSTKLQAAQEFFTPMSKTLVSKRMRAPILGVTHPTGDEGCTWVVLEDLFQKSPHVAPWLKKIGGGAGVPKAAWVHHARTSRPHQFNFDHLARMREFEAYVDTMEKCWANQRLSLVDVSAEDIVFHFHDIKVTKKDEIIALRDVSRYITELNNAKTSSSSFSPPSSSFTSPVSARSSTFNPHTPPSSFTYTTPPSSSSSSSSSSLLRR